MADRQGKMVFMVAPTGEEYKVPAEKVEEAKTKYGWTESVTSTPPSVTPPPTQGVSDVSIPEAVAGSFSNKLKWLGDFARSNVVIPATETTAEFMGGVGSSLLSLPIGAMRVVGVDPAKVPLPTSYSYGGRAYGVPIAGVPSPVAPTQSPEQYMTKLREMGRAARETREAGTDATKEQLLDQPGMTFGSLQEVARPTSLFGKTGEFFTDLYLANRMARLIGGGLPGVSMPKALGRGLGYEVSSGFYKGLKPVQAAVDQAADLGASLFQEIGKTSNTRDAADAATFGSLVNLGLSGLGKTIAGLYNKFGSGYVKQLAKEAADRAMPFVDKFSNQDWADVEYKRELVKRLLETGDDFSETGARKITKRFSDTVDAMKNASTNADDMLQELNKLNLISEEQLKQVNFASEVEKGLNELRSGQVDARTLDRIDRVQESVNKLLPKKFQLDANGNKIPVKTTLVGTDGKAVLDSKGKPIMVDAKDASGNPIFEMSDELDNMTFKEAENAKERLNGVLRQFYENGTLNTEDEIEKQVKLVYANAVRRAQKSAFDSIERLKNNLSPKIPAASKAADMTPWKLDIPMQGKPVSYEEAAQLAKKDADLSMVGIEAVKAVEPQPGKTWFNEMAAAIGLAQFIHGSLFTPSQLATAWQMGKHQQSQSVSAGRLARASTSAKAAREELEKLPERLSGVVGTPVRWAAQPLARATRIPPSIFGKTAAISERKEPSSAESLLSESESRFQILPTPNAAAPAAKEAPKAAVPAAKEKSKKSADYFKSKI